MQAILGTGHHVTPEPAHSRWCGHFRCGHPSSPVMPEARYQGASAVRTTVGGAGCHPPPWAPTDAPVGASGRGVNQVRRAGDGLPRLTQTVATGTQEHPLDCGAVAVDITSTARRSIRCPPDARRIQARMRIITKTDHQSQDDRQSAASFRQAVSPLLSPPSVPPAGVVRRPGTRRHS